MCERDQDRGDHQWTGEEQWSVGAALPWADSLSGDDVAMGLGWFEGQP